MDREKLNYKEHNDWIMKTEKYRDGLFSPIVIDRWLADKMVELGEWENYKNYVVVSLLLDPSE